VFHVVLVNPQIPNNTGTIGRLCVNTGATLHLIEPLGFDIDEKAVRRAGLDYWKLLDLKVWKNFEEFVAANPYSERFFYATTKTTKPYFEYQFQKNDYLIFGSETAGIPERILNENPSQSMTIPMGKEGRSLNLAVSAGIILFEAIKQNFATYTQEIM
jgi:tRNA (cytidine/uridine-2'-O-)-methyltransferase